MILQQLVRDAETIAEGLPPAMHDRKPVAWVVDLAPDGSFQGAVRTSGGGKKDKGAERVVPFVVRTSGIRPILLADTPAYSLGVAPEDKRVEAKHTAYCDLVARCADATADPGVQAVRAFIQGWNQAPVAGRQFPPGMEGAAASDLVTFRVGGQFPMDAPAVRAFWIQACATGDADSGDQPETQCLVCGKQRSVEGALPVLLKGIPGGQSSGTALVSVNANAFESYGMAGNKSAGVCQECGERFGKALNALLAGETSRLYVGGLVYVFWTSQGAGFSLLNLLNRPDPMAVKDLLSAAYHGPTALAVDTTPFYATALTASGGRAVVRDWLHTTLGTAKENLARWFTRLSQVDSQGDPGKPQGVYALAAGLYRDANKEMAAQVPQALIRSALHGDALPPWLLAQAVNRCRAEQSVTYPRAALIKAALLSSHPTKEEYMSSLERDENRPAYLCGRLLAVLEATQRAAAIGKLNTTLVDRFYGAASTAPASVFGNLLSDAQAHLSKLRRTNAPAYQALQQRLEEVMLPLPAFPHTLSLQEQALFSLGYYHQRAADRLAAREHKAAKQQNIEEKHDNE